VTAAITLAVVLVLRDGGGESPPAPATLADYWAGNAHWELAATWTDIDPSGSHMEVVGGRWYLFNRGHVGGTCPDGELRAGVQVRESTDRGATWTAPVMAIAPASGTPWSCAATDGDALYDPASRTWRYLFQCKADGGGWNGCYAERRDASPMSAFSAGPSNPIIRGGDLWGAMCDPGDACAAHPIRESGTYNIFRDDRDGYWISFHGSDGTHGYRGIARTPDFSRFVVDRPDQGVPADAFLGARDGIGFNETWSGGQAVGAGAGAVVQEGRYLYAVNEFADISLRCTDGQNWDVGLFRSTSAASTRWEPFPGGNPIVASSRAPEANGRPPGCNVLYPTMFRDPATRTWYLMHGRGSTDPAYAGIYLYRLVRDASVLVNGDFASLDTRGWTASPGAVVERLPNGSPDGTPYLAFTGELFQDVPVGPELAGRELSFGGTFRAESGSARLTIALQQLDERRRVLHEDAIEVTAGDSYRRARESATLREGARLLRYVVRTDVPARADNMLLQVLHR
jgi:hypothetical protein